MSGTSLPWSPSSPPRAGNDPNEMLRRIEQNTARTFQWTKYLVYLVAILLLAILLFLALFL